MSPPDSDMAAPAAAQGSMVFVHGYMDGPEVWQRTLDRLCMPGWDLHRVRLHAAGTAASSSGAALEHYAQQVVARIDAVQTAARRVVIVGHSMGGQVAELAALQRQDRVAGVVLVTPAPLAGHPLPPDMMARFQARTGLTDPAAIGAGKRALGVGLDDDGVEVLVRCTLATDRATALEQLGAWTGGHASGARASALQMPVLTIATDDRFFTAEMLERNASRFAHASVRKIAGAGHWPQIEQPQALGQVLAAFALGLPAQHRSAEDAHTHARRPSP